MRSTRGLALTLLVLAACTGAENGDASSTEQPTPPAIGGRVDVGGFELSYRCRGEGAPTIVTEAGYDSPGTTAWAGVIDELAEISRVCAYDRAGTGTSDRRPEADAVTSADAADELHVMLASAQVDGPYVLVAHSYGGFIARLFADRYPNETAALVLIESSHEVEIQAYRDRYGENDRRAEWIDGGDLLDIDATEAALRDARDYGSIPLVVVRAERYDDVLDENLWRRTQTDLASLSTDSLLVIASGSGHMVMDPPPDGNPQVLLAAVDAAVDAARSGEPLPACSAFIVELDAACP